MAHRRFCPWLVIAMRASDHGATLRRSKSRNVPRERHAAFVVALNARRIEVHTASDKFSHSRAMRVRDRMTSRGQTIGGY